MAVIPDITLNTQQAMPLLGLGTWQLPDTEHTVELVSEAIELGYRLFDTASMYGNEVSIGAAIRSSKLQRGRLFVVTKINNNEHANPRAALEASLERLGLDYIDQYLIHWPVPERLATWRVLEDCYKQGLVKSIGVSNFKVEHLDELLQVTEVPPAVNQIECNPLVFNSDLIDYCTDKDIAVVAYSPLGQGGLLSNPTVAEQAKKTGKTPAQVLLRWAVQQGTVVIPKSANSDRLKENMEIFDFTLTEEAISALNGLADVLQ